MVALAAQFSVVSHGSRVAKAVRCAGHEWSEDHPDRTKRLRAGEVHCTRCGVIVPVLAALMYAMGKRHGAEHGPDADD